MMLTLTGVLLLILGASDANATELIEPWASVRALGMGNAFTAVAEQGDAIFYNPAALARNSGVHWTIMDPRIGINGTQALETVTAASSGSTLADKINGLYGKAIWVGGGGKTSFVLPNFGVAIYANGDAGFNMQNPAYPQMNISYIADYGIAIGAAIDFIPKIWSLGVGVRRLNRTGANIPIGASVLATLDTTSIQAQLKDRGTGYGLDFGSLITIPGPVSPTLAFTIRNAGTTTFTHDEGLAAPPSSPAEMSIGAALKVDTLLVSVTPSIDYRYIDRTDIQVGKKIHIGAEFDLPLISFRAGLYQGYYTAGMSFDMGVLAFSAATYGVELGEYPGQLEDRRYIVQMTLQIGLDWGDLFSGSGSSSGSGGSSGGGARRKLKQRR